jgi:hypothetical protein
MMKTVSDLPTLVRQLETLNRDLQDRPRQARQIEKELQGVYDDVCGAYLNATPDQRADVMIALEFRGPLVEPLLAYYRNLVAQAARTAAKKRQVELTRQHIHQAAAARVLIGRKVLEEQVEAPNAELARAAASAGADLDDLLEELKVPYKQFMQRALQYHRGRDRIRALKALGLALQTNPALERDDRVLALAATLTGETELSAMITMTDAYLLRKFVQQLEDAETRRRLQTEPRPRTTLDIIRSWFTS